MGFFEKIGLVEEVPTNTEIYEEDCGTEYDEVNAELSEVNTDTLIDDIYSQNHLEDKSRSIFKVEDLINSLPKEMPTESKKSTVTSALGVFNLTSDEVIEDGGRRSETLKSILGQIEKNAEDEINYKEASIEEHKKEIARLEKEISDKQEETKFSKATIESEISKIEKLINFIGGIK